MTSQMIGRYQVLSELGRGGMAVVYRAADPQVGRAVAIKVLPRELLHDKEFRARFQREAEALAALEHPAIVPIYDVGEHDGQPFLVMRLMAGGSLADRLCQGPLGLAEAARIIGQVAPALDHAHAAGIIHRDLKPANILFDQRGHAYLADFGIVKLSEATAQLTGSGSIGTPDYMAPEIARPGGLTPLIDIYALGASVFQMLAGRPPYQADTPMGVLVAHITEPIPDLRLIRPDLPGATQAFVARALAKNPADRYQSAAELAAALAALSDAGVATGATVRVATSAGQPTAQLARSDAAPLRTRRALTFGGAGAGVFVIGLLLVVFVIRPILDRGAPAPAASGAGIAPGETAALPPFLTPRPTLPAGTVKIGVIHDSQGVAMQGQDVIDAGYSTSLDRLVTLTRNTNRLEIVQTPGMKKASVDLPNPGTSLSISPNGLFAAVGHNEIISYYDLQAGRLIMTVPAMHGVSTIALTDSGQAFIVSAQAKGKSLRVIDTTSGFETDLGVAVEGPASLTLTPDGQTLLMVAQIGTSWRLSAYQLTMKNTIRLIGTSSSEIDSCDRLWITPDSRKAITSCGHVFATEPDAQGILPQLDDLTVLGTVRSVGYLSASGELIVAADPPQAPPLARTTAQSNVLNLYDAQKSELAQHPICAATSRNRRRQGIGRGALCLAQPPGRHLLHYRLRPGISRLWSRDAEGRVGLDSRCVCRERTDDDPGPTPRSAGRADGGGERHTARPERDRRRLRPEPRPDCADCSRPASAGDPQPRRCEQRRHGEADADPAQHGAQPRWPTCGGARVK